jgi:serine protease Do
MRFPVRLFHVTRETRLLLLTIAVSVAMLLLLAQFRFPVRPEPARQVPVTPPLERLAARATYDELAEVLSQLDKRLQPMVVVLGIEDEQPDGRAAEAAGGVVPAVRIRQGAALAFLPAGTRPAGVVGWDGVVPEVMASDPITQLAIVRVPENERSQAVAFISGQVEAPRYAAAVEARPRGHVVLPLFLGGAYHVGDSPWPSLLVAATNLRPSQGSLLFGLDGRMIGFIVNAGSEVGIVPASALRSEVERLSSGKPIVPGALDIELQPLTPALSAVAGAARGVMVTFVPPDSSASGRLFAGDVITGFDGTPIVSLSGLNARVASTPPGTAVEMDVVRQGKPLKAAILVEKASREADISTTVRGEPQPVRPGAQRLLGLTLRTEKDAGAKVLRVEPGSAAARAGLRPGDLVTRLGAIDAPRAADVFSAFRSAALQGKGVLAAVERSGSHLVLAVETR